jgi:ABC-type phosphate transport system substrate-binding protein
MSAKVWSLFLLLAILLSACQPAATPQPTVQPLRVQLTPLLSESWLPKLNACSEYLTQSNLLIEVREASELDLQSADLIIRTSADLNAEQAGTYLGAEHLALVVNPENPIVSLSQEEAIALLSGAYAQWKEVPSSAASAQTFDQPVKLIFLVDQDLDAFLSTAFPSLEISPSKSEKAYSVEMAQQLITETPGAIGLLPASALTSALKEVQFFGPDSKTINWELQIVALTPVDPEGDMLQLLLCLQNASQP